MNDFERINGPRVDKLCAALDVIAKSAKSQRVRPDEMHDLLRPVFTKLLHVTGKHPEPKPEVPPEREGPSCPCGEFAVCPDSPNPCRGPGKPSVLPSKHPPRSPQSILAGLTPEEQLAVAYVAIMNVDQEIYGGKLNA